MRIHRLSKSAVLNRLKRIEASAPKKCIVFLTLLEDGSWEQRDGVASIHSTMRIQEILATFDKDVQVFIDTIGVFCDGMYLPEDLIFERPQAEIKKYIDVCRDGTDVEIMSEFILQFEEICGYDDFSDEATRELFRELPPVYIDFYENYKELSIAELVERYKDQRFFTPIPR